MIDYGQYSERVRYLVYINTIHEEFQVIGEGNIVGS